MKGLAPVYSCSEKCRVKGRKTSVHNLNKLEKASTPYLRHVTLVPLVLVPVCGLKGSKATSVSVSVNM
jgi:hypothetical protein